MTTGSPTPPIESSPPDIQGDWRARLAEEVRTMREISRTTDPQEMIKAYFRGARELMPSDHFIALSRRDLPSPQYRITRSDLWAQEVNPWKQKEKLPLLEGGILGELLYSDEPRIIDDLRPSPDDPAFAYLQGQRSLASLPVYDQGVAMNMTVLMRTEPNGFDPELFPEVIRQINIFGRATHNLVLAGQLRDAYAVVERELNAVAAIQRSLLPAQLPAIPGLDVAAYYQTSRHAGGDYYDFFPLPDGRWGIFVADVSGHGTPAAVVMAVTFTLAHSFPGPPAPPSQLLAFLNTKLTSPYAVRVGTFVTAFYGLYDPARRSITYSSAGHNPPRLRRRTAPRVAELNDAQSLPLGIESGEAYFDRTVELAPGDQIVFYTDGITEAKGTQGPMWDTRGFDEAILKTAGTSQQVLDNLLADLARFTGGAPAVDDRTLLVVQVK